MGIAILSGILSSLHDVEPTSTNLKKLRPPPPAPSGVNTPLELPTRLPSRFIACVRSSERAKRVKDSLGVLSAFVDVVQRQNVAAVQQADVVLLTCKPFMAEEILAEPGMKEALAGKLLISICAGMTVADLTQIIYGNEPANADQEDRCRIVRVMPNTAAVLRESITIIEIANPPLPPETQSLVTWIFKQIGEVGYLPPHNMDVSTAVCGSGLAFFAMVIEAAADGAVAMGLPRQEATRMVALAMRGTASLVLAGDHPAQVKDKVSTPAGCTIDGVMVMEDGRVRGTVARTIQSTTEAASRLGRKKSTK